MKYEIALAGIFSVDPTGTNNYIEYIGEDELNNEELSVLTNMISNTVEQFFKERK